MLTYWTTNMSIILLPDVLFIPIWVNAIYDWLSNQWIVISQFLNFEIYL